MASEEEANLIKLKAEAKELGVTGWQSFSDPAKLIAKIEEAKLSEGARKKAPDMMVATSGENTRDKLIQKLEAEDLDAKYLFQSSNLTAEEAKMKGFEIVKKENGEVLSHGNDIVCRTSRKSYYKWQNDRAAHSAKAMQSIDKDLTTDGGGRKIQALKEAPKKGV